ncbi:MAG: 30S ribosomal protein S2 [Deltaproteobacteria bacterium]|jgi:small subunit ribosomal protein S2|nr:30S ribosomal protein S2 [Deltaproteobacteria bacterium]
MVEKQEKQEKHVATLRELLEAGVHFGHQTQRWNPKMSPYIFGERNKIHIIDLEKTQPLFTEACKTVRNTVAAKKDILFVGTKKQAQVVIKDEAERCGMFYVVNRWLGGMMTNFSTVKKSIDKLKKIEKMSEDGTYEKLTKKETLMLERQREKLEKNLGGIKEMKKIPSLIFIADTVKENIAVKEAVKLKIPIIAIADTNSDPEGIDYILPGNDDAIRAIKLFASKIADAVEEGKQIAKERNYGKGGKQAANSVPVTDPEETPEKSEKENKKEDVEVKVVYEKDSKKNVAPEAGADPENK